MSQVNESLTEYYIGLISGTSVDGVDIALVNINKHSHKNQCLLIASKTYAFNNSLKSQIHHLCTPLAMEQDCYGQPKQLPPENRIEMQAELDHKLGLFFAKKINQFMQTFNIDKQSICAIGSHGQTIRHRPESKTPFTIQLGDANIIAYQTGITTVADFRRMDMAAGGQGAPLVPAFHQALMQSKTENRIILNLGGIANITLLPKISLKNNKTKIIGFDTGPANTLLDAHYKLHHPKLSFDNKGEFAKSGQINKSLLKQLSSDAYFKQSPPKSTGREYFNLNWLQQSINRLTDSIENSPMTANDVQATLLELTVETIAHAVQSLGLTEYQIYACGGGVHNSYLLEQLSKKLKQRVLTTNDIGVDVDALEAMTFAWLAYRRLQNKPGNLPSATGAKQAKILGAIYHA